MISSILVDESIESLYNWVKSENYYGWDPYDALNSKIVNEICLNSPLLEILVTQLNRYSVLNIRPILNIEKGLDVKGMSLFAQSFSKMYSLTNNQKYKDDLSYCIQFLKSKSLKSEYDFDCWAGHYFNYRSVDKSILTSSIPDVITTSNVIKAVIDGYFILNDKDLKETGKNAYEFFIKYLLNKTDDNFYYLKYHPLKENKIVINASAEGLSAICRLIPLFDDNEMSSIASSLCEFLIKNQDLDGSWIYSKYNNGKVRHQIDFHQGFILDSLIEYLPFAELDQKESLIESIEKGANFYRNKQFLEDGRCYYRYPKLYPIDIHNQAQGIITFNKLSVLDHKFPSFAKKIVELTISNMQDSSGYFYYQKSRVITNKIPYMRWGASWMMLALATYLEKQR